MNARTNNGDKSAENKTTAEKPAVKDQADNTNLPETIKGRYGIKSAMVVTETELPRKRGFRRQPFIFDDYGAVSYSETVTKMNMKGVPASPKEYNITKGSDFYSWKEGDQTGTKMNQNMIKDLKNMDLEKLGEANAQKK